jgi:phosphosulfolactate synthase
MMMDKGLSARQAEDFVSSSAEYTDIVKFGFGTALVTKNLEDKIRIYKEANLTPYFGGTLFEIYIIRGMFDDYRKLLDKYSVPMAEVSDGSMIIPHQDKLGYIKKLSEQVTVLSEVGSKQADVIFPPNVWVAMMQAEIEAGSWKVIAEARESGTVGIYNPDGSANTPLIDDIVKKVKIENVIWEAPVKSQQAWFIQLLGAHVNLGNIAPDEVVALETLRLGLRGDTFFKFLPEDLK